MSTPSRHVTTARWIAGFTALALVGLHVAPTTAADQPEILPTPLAPPLPASLRHSPSTPVIRDDPFADALDATRAERMRRMKELESKIQAMLQLLSQPTSDVGAAETIEEAASDTEDGQVAPLDTQDTIAASEVPTTAASTPVSKTMTPVEDSNDVVSIDNLSLADSLFGAEEFLLALTAYKKAKPEATSTSQRRWIIYQIASCQRRLGDPDEAIAGYRELVGEDVRDRVTDDANWFLQLTEERLAITTRAETLSNSLHRLEVKLNDELTAP